MIVTAWASGKHARKGVSYGLKVAAVDRDEHFQRHIPTVRLSLPGLAHPVVVNTAKRSFWNGTCRELISAEIRDWMWSNGVADWPFGKPPKFELIATGEASFRLVPLE